MLLASLWAQMKWNREGRKMERAIVEECLGKYRDLLQDHGYLGFPGVVFSDVVDLDTNLPMTFRMKPEKWAAVNTGASCK